MSRKFQVYMMIGMIAAAAALSITAFAALATVPVALADLFPGCSGNPHDRDSGPTSNPHDNGEAGNPHDVLQKPSHNQPEGPDRCPGAK
jgi:hypothetical protein